MSNYAWVCFSCHMAVRRPGTATDVKCPSCGLLCECIGHKTPIPPKSKPKAWEALRQSFFNSLRERIANQESMRVRRVHNLEQEIEKLESLPKNTGRSQAVKVLKIRLGKVRA